MGVAISTTGHEHRLRFLETSVRGWLDNTTLDTSVLVTVDGSATDAQRVADTLSLVNDPRLRIYRVGQPEGSGGARLGVATNKNTGLELLMDSTDARYLFLSDDDTSPRHPEAIAKFTSLAESGQDLASHAMVCWGRSRRGETRNLLASWTWPRGVMLFQTRSVVERVGGMKEAFGLGGHEHVEWSNRIHATGFTWKPYIGPRSHQTEGYTGARRDWFCQDMRQTSESVASFLSRKAHQTSISPLRRWDQINRVMAESEGDTSFVPYRAAANGRMSATLVPTNH